MSNHSKINAYTSFLSTPIFINGWILCLLLLMSPSVPCVKIQLYLVSLLQCFSKVLTPQGRGGEGRSRSGSLAALSLLSLSRPDALMPSAYPGKARCAELFPPGARHLVTLGNVADRYTHPDDQPDPPETLL